jgi:HK97 gp10 family phage protein
MASIKGLDSLMRKLDKLGGNTEHALQNAVKLTVFEAEASAKANAPVGVGSQADSGGSGSLRGSITHEVKRAPAAIEGRVFTNAGHAAYVEFGTGPVGAANHAGISPNVRVSWTTRKYWIYPITLGGKKTFRVTSGQPAKPYLYPAAVEHKDTLTRNVRRTLIDAIRRTAGGG